jgi:hypothetical protein
LGLTGTIAYLGQKSPVSVNLAVTPEMASADGPVIITGFRPKWILLKITDSTDALWILI